MKKITLCSILEKARVISGFAFKSQEFADSGIPVVKINNVKRKAITLQDCQFVDKKYLSLNEEYKVIYGDVLIALTGSHLSQPNSVVGRVARYNIKETALLNQRVGKFIIRDKDKLELMFLYYYLIQDNVLYGLALNAKGSANQANISPSDVERILIPDFDLEIQQKIASILSAYDDLIDINRRRIRLLEEAARLLFREWFVYFRFPGHEKIKIVDGLPEGWRKKKLVEIANITMGQSPKSENYNDEGIGLPFHQGVTGFNDRFPNTQTYCTQNNRIALYGDILFSVRAPVGRLNVSIEKIIIGRGLSAIRSKDNHQSFLFYNLKNHFFKEDMIGGGAIFAAITKSDLENVSILYPDETIIEKFENTSIHIDKQIENLSIQNQKLAQARDLLLPRLMSGKIEV